MFIVEEAECNRDLIKELPSIARSLEADLGADKISAKFAVIGFEADNIHVHTAGSRVLFDRQDVQLAIDSSHFLAPNGSGHFDALAVAAELPFRSTASKNFVLLTCSVCDDRKSRLDYSDIQAMLLTEGCSVIEIDSY